MTKEEQFQYARGRLEGMADMACELYEKTAGFSAGVFTVSLLYAIFSLEWAPVIVAAAALGVTILVFTLWRKIKIGTYGSNFSSKKKEVQ